MSGSQTSAAPRLSLPDAEVPAPAGGSLTAATVTVGKRPSGLAISAEALFSRAAKLSRVDVKKPAKVVGTNTIAVHCHQNFGGQFIDLGIVAIKTTAPMPVTAQRAKASLP